jgi:histidinol dehydrogenase
MIIQQPGCYGVKLEERTRPYPKIRLRRAACDKMALRMKNITESVRSIIETVKRQGDSALCVYARRFDQVKLKPGELRVSASDLRQARKKVNLQFRKALAECGANIRNFAQAEKKTLTRDWQIKRGSVRLGQQIRPVDSVGVYIPGGRYPYPSTVLMTVIPALVAGVKRIVMVTPPRNLTAEVLAAAAFAGCTEVYKIGGAGAIAALAYGTKTVRPVDLIVGPGNAYVTEAKRQVFGRVGIDSLAGPSEVVIIADRSTPLDYILNDLLAQAEHDPDSRSTLLSPDAQTLQAVKKRLDPLIASRVVLRQVKRLTDAFAAANALAPEHLEILLPNAEKYLPLIRHAGAIFLGPATTAVLGDYCAGPSHVLPTSNSARFASGLSVATFMKRSSVIGFAGKPAERAAWEAAGVMADTEGMVYHARSLRSRNL